MYLSLTISNCCGFTHPVLLRSESTKEDIAAAKKIGYRGVEIHVANPALFDWEDIAAFARQEDMKISSIGTGLSAIKHNAIFTSSDPYLARWGMLVLKQFIDVGKITGANIIVGSMKGAPASGHSMEKFMTRLYDLFAPAVDYAEKQGVNLVVEAINRNETPVLNTTESVLEFVEKVNSKRVLAHLDTYHMNIEEKDLPAAIRQCGDKLGHIHFADSDRWYPGHGHIDFQAIIDALYDIGYEGACAFEYLPLPDPATGAQLGYDYVSKMLR